MTALNKRICVGVIRLIGLCVIATASCASLAQAQTTIEVLHSQLTLKEGETTTLALFNASSAPTSPVTITLEIEESAEPFLSIDPAEITISAAGEVMTTITAIDNKEVAGIDPINITLSVTGGNAQLTPTEPIAVSIEDDDVYTIGFEPETITVEEGLDATVQLSIDPAPSGANTVAVALSVSDNEQLTVAPQEVVFSAASTSFDVVVTVAEDAIPESEQTFAISLTPPEDIPARTGASLSVIVPIDSDALIVSAIIERTVIPEGAAASVFIDAVLNRELIINAAVSGLTGTQSNASLSTSSLTLSPDKPSASFNISVADNEESQGSSRTVNVDLTTAFTPAPDLPPLAFTIPPNDLTAYAAMRAEFALENERATQAMTVNIMPPPQDNKSFVVFSEDPRLMVKTGIITSDQSPSFPIELALSENTFLGEEESLSLSISHLDSWEQRSAQAQLSAGFFHTCGIKADSTVVCWGNPANSRTDPASADGVNANTRFLAVSAGDTHTCGIKADSTVACWGNSANGRTNPASGLQGVDANTEFLAINAGEAHTCGITANSTMVCWGDNNKSQSNPASADGIDANTKFFAVSGGRDHTCGIKANSTVACWGTSGGLANLASAAGVDANTKFLAVGTGRFHSCGIKADGVLACRGFGGNNQADPTSSPQGVDANTRFLAINAGVAHNCAIKADGTLACWGFGNNGRTNPTSSPQGVDADTRFLAVSAGDSHTCGIKADGKVACWGVNSDGQASPPSADFAQTPDVFRLAERTTALATRDGGKPVQFSEVAEVEVLHSQLMLNEGETAILTLFRGLRGVASPVAITLAVEEPDKEFLSISPAQLVISEAGGEATARITTTDNDDFFIIDPINVMLSVAVDNIRLTPTETITVNIENNDVYTIGFGEEEIEVAEGASTSVRLSITPTPLGANTVAVALSVSDDEQLTVAPQELVFSAANTSFDVVVNVTEDSSPEVEETFTVSLTPSAGIAAMLNTVSVTVPADNDTPIVRVMVERTVIPEGASALVLIDAALNRELSINMAVPELTGAQSNASLSTSSLTLSPDKPSVSFTISVAGNEEPQGSNRTVNVDLTTTFTPEPDLPPLAFTIPPNDLTAHAVVRAEFTPENGNAIQTMVIDIRPRLQDNKSFLVIPEDPRLIVKTGLITPDQSPFSVKLALSEDTILGQEEPLNLSIVFMDSWRQRSAQAQLSAGTLHSCGIKADGAMVCWGSDSFNRDKPLSAAGVDAGTRFLAVSAGYRHNCAIKADSAVACWGDNNGSQANPLSASGVDADTGFLSVSAGQFHSCGIKADSTVVCWGFDSYSRTDPTSAAGVDADTRFLAVSAGNAHSCGIKADSAVACWGFGGYSRTDPTSAAGVDADTRFLAVSVGHSHSCGIKADGTAACWGLDGDNRASPTSGAQGVDADTRFLAVSAGHFHSCGIKADGAVACWGSDSDNRSNPLSAAGVDANTRFFAVSAGHSHSCGIKADGTAACWGLDGDNQASPPSADFAQTPDVFRLAEKVATLATQDGETAVRLERGLEFLHPQLMLNEGETTTLALFRVLSVPADPVTVTLDIEESDRQFLRINPAQFAISEAGEKAIVSITAIDNEEAAGIDPITIALRVEGSPLLTPVGMTTVIVINNDTGFAGRPSITLEEGMSTDVRLSLDPALLGVDRVAVTLRPSDSEQLAVNPSRLVFSKSSSNKIVVVSVKKDDVAEPEQTFTISMTFPEDIALMLSPAVINAGLSVTVPADEPTVRVMAGSAIIPEGAITSVLIDAFLFHDLSVSVALSGRARAGVSLSTAYLTLGPDKPSASFNISVADNEEPQAGNRTFSVDLTAMPAFQPELPSLTFTIPPNDLTAYAATRTELALEEPEQTMTVNITPELQGNKSFFVSSEDPRLTVKTGIITPTQSSFPVELALNALSGQEERLSLNISFMDSWQQRGAQAQLSAGASHSCGIKTDNTVACWGSDSDNQANPASAAGVNANTSFLAVSAGSFHSCGIKTDNTVACWGSDGDGQANPASAAGVNANTSFFGISAGRHHSCGIKADSTVACWGDNGNNQSSPTSAFGVDADTRFLSVSAGSFHSCGIKADNTVACWGLDRYAQASPTSSPQDVDADSKFLSVSAGSFHSCGIKADNTVACWGFDSNDQSNPASAAGVDANARFFALSAGALHSCGIKADNTAACWGFYGHSLPNPLSSPQGVDANTRFLALSAGGNYNCAIKRDGKVACWGINDLGQTGAPSDSFAQTPDVFRLAERTTILRTQEGDEEAVLIERGLELLHSQLRLNEGETTTLALFKVLRDPTSPITVMLAIEEPDEQSLNVNPAQLTISEAGELMATITAVDNNNFADIEPINITLSITDGNATFTETITVSIENNDVYTIGFDRQAITLEEGMSATVRLSIKPTPLGASAVTVALSVSDNEQLTVEPEELVFSAARTGFDVVVAATDDDVAEAEKIFTVNPTPPQDISAMISAELSVTVSIDSDTPTARVFVERAVVPEGSAVSVLIDADLNRDLTINMAMSGLSAQSEASLSPPSLTLSPDNPSASFRVSVEDNSEAQADNRTFDVGFTPMSALQSELSSITFTIPPNDLTAHAAARAEFTLENERATQAMTVNITPPPQDNKSFVVFSEDPRLMVKTGVITPDQFPFPIELALSEDTALGEEASLSLSVSHVDSWEQRSAQAQLSAGAFHNCGIKTDGRVSCWGNEGSMRSSPTSSPHGVDANTMFLAVSAGSNHSCGIKADSAVACWGYNGSNEASPLSATGVDADTRFLSVSAGASHNCGIKTDGRVACWGNASDRRSRPASNPQVNANTRFLSVSAGSAHSCGIRADSTAACWGSDDNDRSNPASATGVDANTRFLAVSAGAFHSCGIKADGAAVCWGFDGNGQARPTSSSQGVDANTRFLAVSAGAFHSCGIKVDNTVACWGYNGNNEANPLSASGVDADTRFLNISAGGDHSCGIKTDGAVACWGFNGDGQASPPSLSFAQTPDVFRLAERTAVLETQDGEEPVQLIEVTDIGVLHPRLSLNEGETITLELFRALRGIASPVTITLEIEEDNRQFLSINPTQFVISEAGGAATASIEATDDKNVAAVDPINIMLSISGDNARLTPTETITATIEDDDSYTIGFAREAITLEEGRSTSVQLSINPAPLGASTVAVALSVSDNEQLTVEPEEVVFSAASTAFNVVVSVTDDLIPERKDAFTIGLTPPAGIPAIVSAELSVNVPADKDTPIVQVMVERNIIPEGAIASVLIDAILNRELNINLAALGLMGAQSEVSLSSSSLRLIPDKPSASFNVSVADNEEPQAGNRIFNVGLSAASTPQPELPSLTFIIPPNDLTAHAAMRAEFKLEEPEQTLTINIRPPLQDNKSFIVSSDDPRLTVKSGVITPAQSPVLVELALSEGTVLGKEDSLSLNISHLDSWKQRSAQAQLSAGFSHNCGIKADGAIACWGFNGDNRAKPMSSRQDVDAATRFLAVSVGQEHSCGLKTYRKVACWGNDMLNQANPASAAGVEADASFLAVSAGGSHSCGIKADRTLACWGGNDNNQTDPTLAAGVEVNTRFLAVSAGDHHSCGIKADGAVVCWGLNDDSQANPASAAGVEADTRFLAVSAGGDHSCGIKADGAVACWGLAANSRTDPASAAGVDADTRFLAVSAGGDHSCGIKVDSAAACWGLNNDSQANPASAAGVEADTRFLAVSAGGDHSCGIKTDGTVACWGSDDDNQANPPSLSFAQTPDVFRLAEQSAVLATEDGGDAVQFGEVTEVELLHPQLMFSEGESATLTLFRLLSGPASPLTITLAVEESEKRLLTIPEKLILTTTERESRTTITAPENADIAYIDPIRVRLSIAGDNARLTPVKTITVGIENNDFYNIIGFDREAITLKEGESTAVQLNIDPAPANTVTVDLSSSDEEQLTVASSVTFAANTTNTHVSVSAIDDADKEKEQAYTILLSIPDDIPVQRMRTDALRVTVPPDARDSSIVVTVEPTNLRITAGRTKRIVFAVPERFIITGDTTIRLTAEGDITVTPQIILNKTKRAESALVKAAQSSTQVINSGAAMEPRPATISLSATSDTEDPRLFPGDTIHILIEESVGIRVKVRVYLEGALP